MIPLDIWKNITTQIAQGIFQCGVRVFKFPVLEVILPPTWNNGFIANCLYKLNKNDPWSLSTPIVLPII